ncbi:MAG: hypothetical protein ACXW3L_09290, partial [Limisphaerales bacterium]
MQSILKAAVVRLSLTPPTGCSMFPPYRPHSGKACRRCYVWDLLHLILGSPPALLQTRLRTQRTIGKHPNRDSFTSANLCIRKGNFGLASISTFIYGGHT